MVPESQSAPQTCKLCDSPAVFQTKDGPICSAHARSMLDDDIEPTTPATEGQDESS